MTQDHKGVTSLKKNNKGFTLVELVVVSTLMVMIMGAILNFIRPINNLFTSTHTTADSNDIGNSVMDYIENEVRYSTNMVVLEDFPGVPLTKDGYLLNPAGNKAMNTLFTDVLIIDNANPRGSQLKDYDATDSPAHRKGATGVILKAPLDSTGINISKAVVPLNEELYNDYSVTFDCRLSTADSNNCLSVGMRVRKPEYDYARGRYTFRKTSYKQTRDLELVNINLLSSRKAAQGIQMSVSYYSNRVDEHGTPYGTEIGNRFGTASAPGGLTEGQAKLFSTAENYTYIFYTKVVPSSATTSKVNIRLLDNSGSVLDQMRNITSGTTIDAGKVSSWKAMVGASITRADASTGTLYEYTFDNLISTTGKEIDYYTTNGFDQSMDFSPNYNVGTAIMTPNGKVSFYDCFDTDGSALGSWGREVSHTFVYTPNPLYPQYTNTLGALPNEPSGNDEYMFLGWYESWGFYAVGATPPGSPLTEADLSTTTFSGNKNYYACYQRRPKYEVKFLDKDGNEISGFTKEYTGGKLSETGVVFDKPGNPADTATEKFVGWFVDGNMANTELSAFDNLTSDTVFGACFQPIPAEWTELTVTLHYVNNFNHFTGTGASNGDVYAGVSSPSSQCYWADMYCSSGTSATFKLRFKSENPATFNMNIYQDWSMYCSPQINTVNFIGKTSADIYVDASGSVSYS